MSTVGLEKLPGPVARAIQAGKRLRITHDGNTIATVEPQKMPRSSSRRSKSKLTARQWLAWNNDLTPARPDLDAARIIRAARDQD